MTNAKRAAFDAALPLRRYMAADALRRVANLPAFKLDYETKHKLNQHATLYTFIDSSRLIVNHTSSKASCWHPDWKGTGADIYLGPIENMPLRINARGE